MDGIGWNVDEPAFQKHFMSDFQTVLDGGAWPSEFADLPPAELARFLRDYLDTNAFAGIVRAETGRQGAIGIELASADPAERAFGQYLLRLLTTYEID